MSAADYRPGLPAADVERIRQWHERAYADARTAAGTGQTFEYLGRIFVVPPEVMPITPVSHLLGEAVLAEVREGDRVLDMGTGSGVNAILAASRAARVLAVDINPVALRAAADNARRNGVADRIQVRPSDVFSAIPGGENGVFDLIVFDPPFRWFPARDLLESAMTDEGYRALTTFFREADRHLAAGGRMLVFFGSTGDVSYLDDLIRREGFRSQIVARADLVKDGWRVDYFTVRLTRAERPG